MDCIRYWKLASNWGGCSADVEGGVLPRVVQAMKDSGSIRHLRHRPVERPHMSQA